MECEYKFTISWFFQGFQIKVSYKIKEKSKGMSILKYSKVTNNHFTLEDVITSA